MTQEAWALQNEETQAFIEAAANQPFRYAQFRSMDVANGVGIRVVLFVSGCRHHCPGCFNELYQNFNYGEIFDEAAERRLLEALDKPQVAGLTLLGGEPMQNPGLIRVLRKVRETYPMKTIWVYSGYTYEQILEDPARHALVDLCDVLVDGLFVEAERDLKLRFRGSRNQRIIDVAASRSAGAVVLYME